MNKAKIFAKVDVVLDVDVALPEEASEYTRQQHKDEVCQVFEAKLKEGFTDTPVHISYFEFEID